MDNNYLKLLNERFITSFTVYKPENKNKNSLLVMMVHGFCGNRNENGLFP